VAAGEPLPLSQDDIVPAGHAIEARIYPEDPDTFLPNDGAVTELHLPSGEHIRVDSALFDGYEVPVEYEPLMAKVMAWGETRQEAVKHLQKALLAFRLEGVKCNILLMRYILATKEFTGAAYHTGSMPLWVEERKKRQLCSPSNGATPVNGNGKADREIAAAIGVAMAIALKGSQPPGSSAPEISPWRIYGRREQLLSRTLGKRSWR
jgi:acetyl-CoA carboxylase biotin carboxylase subunit